jgi:hypothetical protein
MSFLFLFYTIFDNISLISLQFMCKIPAPVHKKRTGTCKKNLKGAFLVALPKKNPSYATESIYSCTVLYDDIIMKYTYIKCMRNIVHSACCALAGLQVTEERKALPVINVSLMYLFGHNSIFYIMQYSNIYGLKTTDTDAGVQFRISLTKPCSIYGA